MCLPECVSLSPPDYPLWLMEHSSHRLASEDYIWTTHRHACSHSRTAEAVHISERRARAKPTYTQIYFRLKPLCIYTHPGSTYAQSGLAVKANVCSNRVQNCHGNTHTMYDRRGRVCHSSTLSSAQHVVSVSHCCCLDHTHTRTIFLCEGMSRTLFALSQPSLLKHDAVPVTKPLSLAGANINLICVPNELIITQVQSNILSAIKLLQKHSLTIQKKKRVTCCITLLHFSSCSSIGNSLSG